ncbi:MAG: hypothetical protein LC799_25465 [Actinobacteria bacterium]|nr:hypothetical protein [Actinomycetota bacterium]
MLGLNLLPEGRLGEWIAADRKVSPQREMDLLAQANPALLASVHDSIVARSRSLLS